MTAVHTLCCASQHSLAAGDKCFLVPIALPQPAAGWELAGEFLECRVERDGSLRLAETDTNLRHLLAYFSVLQGYAAVVPRPGEDFNFAAYLEQRAPRAFVVLSCGPVANSALPAQEAPWAQLHACWEYLWPVVAEGKLALHHTFRERRRELTPYAFAVLHESSYRFLVVYCSQYGRPAPQTPRAFFDQALRVAQQQADRGTRGQREAGNRLWEGLFLDNLWRALNVGEGPLPTVRPSFAIKARLDQEYLERSLSVDELFERLRPWLEDQYVTHALDQLHIPLLPLSGDGARGEQSEAWRACQDAQVAPHQATGRV